MTETPTITSRSTSIEVQIERPLLYPYDGSDALSRSVDLVYTMFDGRPSCHVKVEAANRRADGSYGVYDWTYTWWGEAALACAPRWLRGLYAANRPQWHLEARR